MGHDNSASLDAGGGAPLALVERVRALHRRRRRACVADAAVIIGVSVAGRSGLPPSRSMASVEPLRGFVSGRGQAAGIFVLPAIFRGEYDAEPLPRRSGRTLRRAFTYWNITFVTLLALAFLTRADRTTIRARSMLLFYVIGLPAVVLTRYALVSTVILGSKVGLVTAQRVFLIGSGEDISGFVRRYQPWNYGLHTVGAAPLTRLDPSATPRTAPRGARRRSAPGDRHRAHAAPGRGLYRDAMVRDRARSTAASTNSSTSRSRSTSDPSAFSTASRTCASPSTAGWRACSSRARRSPGPSGC